LERIPEEPDVLINVGVYDLPSTADLILLGNRGTPALVNCLINNLDSSARSLCADVLIATRDARAIEPLIAALDDPSNSVRVSAIQALGRIESSAATPKLLAMLEDPNTDGWVQDAIVKALAANGDPTAIDPLFAFFQESRDNTVQTALWSVRRLLSPDQRRALILSPLEYRGKYPPYSSIAFAVERAGDFAITEAMDHLIFHYPEAGSDLQNRIIYNLGRIGDKRAIPFVEGLIDPTGSARLLNNVVFALDRLGVDVGPLLREILADQRAYIRYNAAFVAGDLKLKLLTPELSKALEDFNDIVRSEAALALGKIGDPTALPVLEIAAAAENPLLRRDAILALLNIDRPKYLERAMKELRETELLAVREALLDELLDGKDQSQLSELILFLDPKISAHRNLGVRILDRFETCNNPDVLAFLVRVASVSGGGYGGHDARHHAFRLLGRFADPRTAFILEQWVVHPDQELSQVLRALARMNSTGRKEVAREYFEREGTKVQLYAAFYLASQGEQDAMQKLLDALEFAPIEFKINVAIILTELDYAKLPGAKTRLIELSQHPDVYVRLYACRALTHWGYAEGIEQLEKELAKRIPFIDAVVFDILKQLPDAVKLRTVKTLLPSADPVLKRELERIAGLESGLSSVLLEEEFGGLSDADEEWDDSEDYDSDEYDDDSDEYDDDSDEYE
jgi:HEAT repeat protein